MSTDISTIKEAISTARYIRLFGVKNGREDLADYVKRIRFEKGLSQRDVEARSGGAISKGYIGQIENRAVLGPSVTPQKLEALAVGLGVLADEVVAIARGKSLEGDPEFEKSEIAALFYDYKELTPKDQEQLRAIWDMLKAEIKRRKMQPKKD